MTHNHHPGENRAEALTVLPRVRRDAVMRPEACLAAIINERVLPHLAPVINYITCKAITITTLIYNHGNKSSAYAVSPAASGSKRSDLTDFCNYYYELIL